MHTIGYKTNEDGDFIVSAHPNNSDEIIISKGVTFDDALCKFAKSINNYYGIDVDIEVLTINEVSDILRLSPWTIRKMVRNGKLKTLKLSRAYRFLKKDVIDLFLLNN